MASFSTLYQSLLSTGRIPSHLQDSDLPHVAFAQQQCGSVVSSTGDCLAWPSGLFTPSPTTSWELTSLQCR